MNPLKYNNVELPSWLKVLDISGLDVTSPFDIAEFKPVIGDGSRNLYLKRKTRTVKVKCDVVGGTNSEIRAKVASIAQYLYPSVMPVLIDFGIDDKTYIGNFVDSSSDESYAVGKITLEFRCDPYRYGDGVSETDVDGKALTNAGTAACFGVLSFTLAEETSFGITLNGTTGYIGIISAPAGDYEINLKTRKLYKDSVLANNYFDTVNTIFDRFIITPGAYQIDVTGSVVVDYDYMETFL